MAIPLAAAWLIAAPASVADAPAVLDHYAAIVHAAYADSLTAARAMQQSVDAVLAPPSASTLDVARKAWRTAREPYGQTEVFRFYGRPIDDDKDIEGCLNSWPLDEAYVDSVKGKQTAGIINNPKIALNIDRLIKLNAKDGEANVATGYHAIEFLLWSQDFNANGPGSRPYTDFTDGQGANAERRRRYLSSSPTRSSLTCRLYRTNGLRVLPTTARFLAKKPDVALRKILTGMPSLPVQNWPASACRSPWTTRTRRTSTAAFPTTPIGTSSPTPLASAVS